MCIDDNDQKLHALLKPDTGDGPESDYNLEWPNKELLQGGGGGGVQAEEYPCGPIVANYLWVCKGMTFNQYPVECKNWE